MGINNIKANDYVNVIIQALAHVTDFRDVLLTTNVESKKTLTKAVSDCFRKIWNPRAFKAHLSPHELMAVSSFKK